MAMLRSGDVDIHAGSFLSGPAADTDPNLWGMQFHGSSSWIRRNGTDVAGGNAGTEPWSNSGGMIVGANTSINADWFEGDVHGLIFYNRSLTSAEIADIEAYLLGKWGLNGS